MGVGYGIAEGFYRHVIFGMASDSDIDYTHCCDMLLQVLIVCYMESTSFKQQGSFSTHKNLVSR